LVGVGVEGFKIGIVELGVLLDHHTLDILDHQEQLMPIVGVGVAEEPA
jgi:hypothetical protein